MKQVKGFTLIEILMALAVFAILATITSSAMYNAFETKERITEQADRLAEIQLAITFMQRDITQIVDRGVRDNMAYLPAFAGDAAHVEFTRGGIANPDSEEKRSTLKRIAYFCQSSQLVRRAWFSLDSVDRSVVQNKVLLNNLSACTFAYLNSNLQVLHEWRANAMGQNQNPEPFPKAIQFNISLKNSDKMSFLFIIPAGLYATKV